MFAFLFKPAQTPYPKDIRSLTSLRFFAALAIVIFHYTYEFEYLRNGLPGRFYTGADFFFILSGFILSHSYAQSIEEGIFSARTFYIKRFARIYPVHIITLLLSAMTTGTTLLFLGVGFDEGDSFGCLVSSALMVQSWGIHTNPCFNNPSWSISAEWFAYFLFPMLAVWALKKNPWMIIFGSAAALIILCITFDILGKPFTQITAHGFIRILPDFILGVGLYLLGRKNTFKKAGRSLLYGTLAVLCASFILNVPDALIILIYGVLIFTLADLSRRETKTALDNNSLVYWGEASYSLYMIHNIVWEALPVPVMMRDLDGSKIFDMLFFLACAASLIITFVASHYTYLYYEKPSRAWICKRFIREGNQPPKESKA